MKPSSWGARGAAALILAAVAAAALAVYLPTPGNQWIRYDNEALIRATDAAGAPVSPDHPRQIPRCGELRSDRSWRSARRPQR